MLRNSLSNKLAKIDEILEDARNGKMFILVDDENRENEGDLIIPADFADAKAINFMAKYGRGLICLALTKKRVDELGLSLMPRSKSSRQDTAFTVSIEARDGIDTGISASDRARTIQVAINQSSKADEIVTPGHIFPLVARDGGVLVRAGHTEAAVDISRMAGLNPSGVICEIMKDDGTMARLPDLIEFAKEHNLKIASIADLISYRLSRDRLVEKIAEETIDTEILGECRIYIYKSTIDETEHLAIVKGEINSQNPTYVRMHSLNLLDDLLGDKFFARNNLLEKSLKLISQNGSGVAVILREPRKDAISVSLKKRIDGNSKGFRDYGIGAQILSDIGVREMILLSNQQVQVIGLEGYDLVIKDFKKIA